MKTSRIIIVAFAAALSLVSCTKENAEQKNSSSASEPRVFTVEFSKPTRTTLSADGITPVWQGDDKIWISNSESGEEVEVSVSGNTATISTKLQGTLKAVYPSSAVVKDGSGVISDISVPATQHGTFAESNICMAEDITEGAEIITFVNKTAVLCFYVDESIGVTQIEIEGDGVATGGNKITVAPASGTLYNVGGGPDPRICYAAVLPVLGKDIKLTGTATSQTQPRTIPSATLAANTIYNAFIPYYIDLGTVGKWGYCNVGAFLPEETGLYFAWGDVVGQAWIDSSWSGNGFSEPYPVVSGNTLSNDQDAAFKKWGDKWHMPEVGDLYKLANLSHNWDNANMGYLFTANNGNSVFLPAAGSGRDNILNNNTTHGNYWANTLYSERPAQAMFFPFYEGYVGIYSHTDRSEGNSVRAISD